MASNQSAAAPGRSTGSPGPEAGVVYGGSLRKLRAKRSLLGDLSYALNEQAWGTIKYLTRTDVHTFAFSVAANAILSFFPFMVLLLTVTRRVFHSNEMRQVILNLLQEYLPSNQKFISDSLSNIAKEHPIQALSIVMLCITSTGVFLPLEVALNRVWGFRKNRSYFGNQLVSLGLAVATGILALTSVALTATNHLWLKYLFFGHFDLVSRTIGFVVMKTFAIAATIAIFFLIYWLLPNGKVPIRAVLPAAVITGGFLEGAKYLYVLSLPFLDFQKVYGPFHVSVTLIFWAFLSGMLLLAGAHLSAVGRRLEDENASTD